jgi:hypothetical protein
MTLPCAFLSTLGKNHVWRVPVNLHTANYGAHGKIEVSGSAGTPYRTTVCFLGHAPMGMHFDATICTRPFFSAPHPFIGSVMLHRISSSALLVPLVEACHLRVFSLAVSSGPIWIWPFILCNSSLILNTVWFKLWVLIIADGCLSLSREPVFQAVTFSII